MTVFEIIKIILVATPLSTLVVAGGCSHCYLSVDGFFTVNVT
jgi:hypothetical protein